MAKEKRMFNVGFMVAESFKMNLSNKSKLLYTYIVLSSDDRGFCDNVKELIVLLNGNDHEFLNTGLVEYDYKSALQDLLERGYLIWITDNHGNDIYLVRHWYLHNQIPKDRVNESRYETYLDYFEINDENEYECVASVKQVLDTMYSKCDTQCNTSVIHIDKQVLTQIKLNKSKLKKIKINIEEEKNQSVPTHGSLSNMDKNSKEFKEICRIAKYKEHE